MDEPYLGRFVGVAPSPPPLGRVERNSTASGDSFRSSVCGLATDEREAGINLRTAVRMTQLNPLLTKRSYLDRTAPTPGLRLGTAR